MFNNGQNNIMSEYLNNARSLTSGYVSMGDLNIAQSVLVNPDVITETLEKIDSVSDQTIYDIIKTGYNMILDPSFINKPKNKIALGNAFQCIKFVSAFVNTLTNIKLDGMQSICANRLIYDYFTSSRQDSIITNALYTLGLSLNGKNVSCLCGKGLDRNLAIYLSVARHSSTNVQLTVKRVNVIIINTPKVMSEQMIVWIYEELYPDKLMDLFNGIMFDAWDFKDEELALEEEQEDTYATINLAILDILNEIPTTMCVQLFRNYAQAKQYNHREELTRFDIHAISEADYGRVLQAIELVESEGVMVPHR